MGRHDRTGTQARQAFASRVVTGDRKETMKQPSNVKERNRLDEQAAVAAIDLALRETAHRGLRTHDEAVELLNRLVGLIECPEHVEAALSSIDRAKRGMQDQALVDRGQIVDVLLDVRLALEPIAHQRPTYPLATRPTGA
jgi:hypothetical protein